MLITVRRSVANRGIRNVIFFGASELKTLYFSFIGLDINLVVWHGTTKSHPKRDPLHRLVYSNVAHYVTLSQHLLRNVQQILPLTRHADFRLITPSQDIKEHDPPADTDHDVIKIVHVGRIVPSKGQLEAVRVVERLADAGYPCELVILGENNGNKYAQAVTQAISVSTHNGRIKTPGFVDDVCSYLQSMDIFLFPSRGEGMPGAVVEALHFPLVCLTYNNTVFPEFAELGFHFHTVADGNIEQLGDKLLAICADLENEKRQAKRNPALARKLFDSRREVQEWLDILV